MKSFVLACVLALVGCNSISGVNDLHEEDCSKDRCDWGTPPGDELTDAGEDAADGDVDAGKVDSDE